MYSIHALTCLRETPNLSNTSMHSSRMRTARLLPVSSSMDATARGRSAPWGLLLAWVCSWAGSAPGLGLLLGGGIPACNGADLPVNRILDTRF